MNPVSCPYSYGSSDLVEYASLNGGLLSDRDQLDLTCLLCSRVLFLESEVNGSFEGTPVCRECKVTVLDGSSASTSRRAQSRRQCRRRARNRNSESLEDLFSHQFSQLISLVRQNQELQSDADVAAPPSSSFSTPQSRSGRWIRFLSDNESDGFNYTDSLFGDSDSNASFRGYGAFSDSMDAVSLFDGDTDMLLQLDDASDVYTETDIDPMHAGLEQWDSDDGNGEWEAEDVGHHAGIFELESFTEDTIDARGSEALLEQLAMEVGGSRGGLPPASVSYVDGLPTLAISKEHEKHGVVICAVCKDPLHIGSEAKQLPCMHLFHPSCILPWLCRRNSCPVCRYELPTDDPDYEHSKRVRSSMEIYANRQQDTNTEDLSNLSVNEVCEEQVPVTVELNVPASTMEGRRRNWLHVAAVPIISIASIVLVYLLQNPLTMVSNQCNPHHPEHQHPQSYQTGTAAERNKKWWLPF